MILPPSAAPPPTAPPCHEYPKGDPTNKSLEGPPAGRVRCARGGPLAWGTNCTTVSTRVRTFTRGDTHIYIYIYV